MAIFNVCAFRRRNTAANVILARSSAANRTFGADAGERPATTTDHRMHTADCMISDRSPTERASDAEKAPAGEVAAAMKAVKMTYMAGIRA